MTLLRRWMTLGALLFGLLGFSDGSAMAADPAASAYDFAFTSIEGEPLPLSDFRGQVVLLVNTASRCGFTPQYEDLQAVWERYRERGLVVLGVPSNDFGGQEPGSEAEIKQFCEVNFDVDFPLTSKEQVVGEEAHPFYRWAVEQFGFAAKPRWNFHKYLIGPDGKLADWFATTTKPTAPKVTEAIEAQLAKVAKPASCLSRRSTSDRRGAVPSGSASHRRAPPSCGRRPSSPRSGRSAPGADCRTASCGGGRGSPSRGS